MAVPGVPSHASASLYVGNLSYDVNEVNLLEVFSVVGPVASIRVCRDNIGSRQSLGYAYVNFHNIVDAERALDTLNYAQVKNRPCRIMWSQRDPSIRKTGAGNIFIKNLDKTIDNKSLHDTFSVFGNILSCKVVTDDHGNSRGYGYVHYEKEACSDTAIAKVNGMLMNDKKVFVGRHISRRERDSKAEEIKKNFRNVFVKNLDPKIGDAELNAMFSKYGTVTSCVVMRGTDGATRGFGFVNFEDHESANKAVEALHESGEGKEKLFVSRAQKKGERMEELQRQFEQRKQDRLNKYQGVNLYVKNLDDTVDDEKLRQEFSQFGNITSAKIADDKGVSKGFGFVCYSTQEEATKAVTEMNGRMVGSKPIYVAPAQRKEVRKQHLETQYLQRQQMRMAQQPGVGYMGPPMFYANPPPPNRGGFMGYGVMAQRSGRGGWNPGQGGGRPFPGGPAPVSNYEGGNYISNVGQARGGRGQTRNTRPNTNQNMPKHGGAVQSGQAPAGGNRGRPSGAQYKFHPNVRNRVDAGTPNAQAPANTAPAATAVAGQEPITTAALAALTPEEQKQTLGERIFMMVRQQEPEFAAKITGMLLEMDNSELLHLLESPQGLSSKVEEAMAVLRAHNSGEIEQE